MDLLCDLVFALNLSPKNQNFLVTRHVHGSQKWIPGSDPKDLDLGSYWIIDPDSQVCREIPDPGSHIVEGLSEIIDLKYFYTARSTGIQTRKQPIGVQLIKKLQLRKSNTNRGTTTILASLSNFEVR